MSNHSAPVAGVERVGSKEKGGGEPVSSQSQNVHFRTYGTDNYNWTKARIVQEALDTGWFASVKALGPDDLTAEFKKKFENILKLPRGGGYWIWKYDVIQQTLDQMKEGDFLVFLDAGSQVNKGGEERFREYLKIVNESQYDMLCFQYTPKYAEYKWTTEKIFRAFNVSMEDPIRLSGQIEGGTLLMQKGPHLRSWLKIIKDALLQDPWIITDTYNHETKALTRDFKDNRHDQSLSSVSRKIHGCEMLSAHESNDVHPHKPFHVMRMIRQPQEELIEELQGSDSTVKFCGSNMWLGSNISCEKRAQFLVSTYRLSEQNAKSSLLESGCQCSNSDTAVVKPGVGSEEEGGGGGGGGGALAEELRVDHTSLPSWNISAIIPTCNRLHSLQDAIESALKQTYPVLEVIVSIDSGPDCVESIKNIWEGKDDRVRVFKVPPCPQNPCGLGRSRNHAIKKASPYATHFALLDDDDVWYPHKTEIQVKTMKDRNYSYSSSDANVPRNGRCQGSEYTSHDLEKEGAFFLANGGKYKPRISKRLNIPLDTKLPSHVTRKELSAHNIFVASATIFSKDIYYSTSGFDERIDKIQEYRLWLEFAKISPGLFITDPLVVYDNNRNGCDVTYTSDLYVDVSPEIKLQLQQEQQQILEELNVKFCGSNKWLGSHISCEKRAQSLVSSHRVSEQNAKSSLLDSGCQCNSLRT